MPDRPGNVSRANVAGSPTVRTTTMSVSSALGIMLAVSVVAVAAAAMVAIGREEIRRRRVRRATAGFEPVRVAWVAEGRCIDCGHPMDRTRIRAGEVTCGICEVG